MTDVAITHRSNRLYNDASVGCRMVAVKCAFIHNCCTADADFSQTQRQKSYVNNSHDVHDAFHYNKRQRCVKCKRCDRWQTGTVTGMITSMSVPLIVGRNAVDGGVGCDCYKLKMRD